MASNHFGKLLNVFEIFALAPDFQENYKTRWKQIIIFGIGSTLFIHNTIYSLLAFRTRLLCLLQLLSGILYQITNTVCVFWLKRHVWSEVVASYTKVDIDLDRSSVVNRKKDYIKLIMIFVVVKFYLIVSFLQYYFNNQDDLNIIYHITMFLQICYQLMTYFLIIFINIFLKIQYRKINSYLERATWDRSCILPQLNLVERSFIMMKVTVDNVNDVFGWQIMILHGRSLINLLGLLSEVSLKNKSVFGLVQWQESVFTVS